MSFMQKVFFILGVCIFAGPAQARVFNINDETCAAYLGSTYSPFAFTNTLNSDSVGTGSTVDSKSPYNFSGEFGFLYASDTANFRFGLEVIRPTEKSANGTDASGTSLYSLTSDISVLIPKVGMEINLKKWTTNRLFFEIGAGYASLAGRNSYSFTTPGNTAYGLSDFSEDLRSSAPLYEGNIGFEGLMTDTITYVIEGGYRYLHFTSVKQNKDATTFQGSVSKGDAATNLDGSARILNMSNYYVGFSLRFWVY